MKKTGLQIEQDFYDLVKGSAIDAFITGSTWKDGTRPVDSQKEDALIIFISGLGEQLEIGVVNVNVHVPMLDIGSGKVKDTSRCRAVEGVLQQFLDDNTTYNEYHIQNRVMIQTYKVQDRDEYFVSMSLKFKRFTF